ncbi:oligosaccharide flippase family protein [Paenalkalicoccus suaedae]|uniref:Oligosaccharide flippase family protein n=1 Tax=Paenalkalicoccus suaedae TaxID=2592382 RepID=A0A859FGV7_9BACI|nr:oligosaccharide flippase family protein [Paenalkalicoccus suaedae]QKS72603.1 oligosaccharide flippase family protein [Paenalkalicoccus suaedae]
MNIRQKYRSLIKEDLVQKLAKNVGVLFSGSAIAQVLGIMTLAMTTRLIGPEMFGILVIIQAYTVIVDKLINFQSWTALIKFGTEALENQEHKKFKGFIKIATILDLVSAIIATVVAFYSIQWVGQFIGLRDEYILITQIYCLSILFHISGTPIAILRIYDKFKLIAINQVVVATIKFFAILVLFTLGLDNFWLVVAVWIICEIISHIVLMILGYTVLFRKRVRYWWKGKTDQWKEFFKFTCWTNISTTVNLPVKQFDVIIVSVVVSLEGVAIYKIFKQIAAISNKVADPVFQAIYPQLVKMIISNEPIKAVKFVLKTSILLCSVLLPTVFLISISAPIWLGLIFGEVFAKAWKVLAVYLVIEIITQSLIGIHPLFTAMGFVKKNVFIILTANILYIPIVLQLGDSFGLIGIVTAYGVQFCIVLIIKAYYINRYLQTNNRKTIDTAL